MNKNDLIKLSDGNDYVIVSKIIYEETPYLYLVDIRDNASCKFCIERKVEDRYFVDEIEDKELIQKLLPLFYEEVNK